jgi:hypothetical protein
VARTRRTPRRADGATVTAAPTLVFTGFVAALLLMGVVLVLATVGLVICAAVAGAHPVALLAIPIELLLIVATYRTTSYVLARMDHAPVRARLRVDAAAPYRVSAAPEDAADVEAFAAAEPEPKPKASRRRT